jgi:hypothetical protein
VWTTTPVTRPSYMNSNSPLDVYVIYFYHLCQDYCSTYRPKVIKEAESHTMGGLLSWSFLKLAMPLCLPKDGLLIEKFKRPRLCLFVYDLLQLTFGFLIFSLAVHRIVASSTPNTRNHYTPFSLHLVFFFLLSSYFCKQKK